MRNWRIVTALLLCLVLAGLTACNPFGETEQEVTEELVEVVRGDLTVTVSGSGNIEVSNEMKLAFGVAGRVYKIYVQEGDEVSKRDVLAKLKTDALELAITQAQVAETTAQLAQTKTQLAVTEAQVAQTNAQLALQTAEDNLEKAQDLYAKPDILTARTAVTEAQSYLEYAEYQLAQASTTKDITVWTNEVTTARERLRAARVSLSEMLSAPDTAEVAIARLQVESANQSLELAHQSLELAQQSLELDEQSLEQAQQSLEQAQKQLDEATITAPFDGIVANIYADEGDIIPSPSMGAKIIIHLIDSSSMVLKVQVDEIDVTEVKLGQRAIIEVDALPSFPLEGKVSFISLLPTIEAGVIVYDVKVEFDVPEGVGLRAGMSATADIVIAERSNVLLVPDRAIKQDSQGNTIVEVVVNEQSEERAVVTGISDGFQTEIVDGLREGETVVERRAKPKPSGPGFF